MQIYVPLEGSRSNVVHTAWALMGLIHAGQVCFQNTNVCHELKVNIYLSR
jgi:hypothetical protein